MGGFKVRRDLQRRNFGFVGHVDLNIHRHGTGLRIKQHREPHHTSQNQHNSPYQAVFGATAQHIHAFGLAG
jgi:hypothetical protein